MKNPIKKVLVETYKKQYLHTFCNVLTTGTNHKSIEFMERTIRDLLELDLSEDIKKNIKILYGKWKRDILSNGKDIVIQGTLKGATPDSEGDISNIYLSQLQDILCPIYMEMD